MPNWYCEKHEHRFDLNGQCWNCIEEGERIEREEEEKRNKEEEERMEEEESLEKERPWADENKE